MLINQKFHLSELKSKFYIAIKLSDSINEQPSDYFEIKLSSHNHIFFNELMIVYPTVSELRYNN